MSGPDEERLRRIRKHHDDRLAVTPDKPMMGAERVDLKLLNHLAMESTKKSYKWTVDEPEERGGTGTGPNPLAYFLSGAASCLMNHFMTESILAGAKLGGLEMTARAHYTLAPGASFREVLYDIRVSSDEPADKLLPIYRRAEELCMASNTLRNAGVKFVVTIFLNGTQVL